MTETTNPEFTKPYRPLVGETDSAPATASAGAVTATPIAMATSTIDPVASTTGGKKTRNRLGDSGWLQKEILAVCRLWWEGNLPLGEKDTGKPFTPHRIANAIEARGHTRPSSGAVSACLSRWDEYGFANINKSPVSFVSFTELASSKELSQIVAEHRTKAWEAKKAEKLALKAAEVTAP